MAKPKQYPFHRAIKMLLPRRAARKIDHRVRLHFSDAVIISYPKSGRTWLRAMLTLYFASIYGTPKDCLVNFANLHNVDRRIPKIHFSHETDYKGPPEGVRIDRRRLQRKKLIFLARDPRDVIVSLYAHRVHRDRDWDGPIEDFIASSEGGFPTTLHYFQLWSDFLAGHDDALVLRYEDLHADSANAFAGVLRHLGLPIDETSLRQTVEETQFARLQKLESRSEFQSGRLNAKDPENPHSFKVRRGKIGGFTDDVDPAMVEQIGRMMDCELQGAFGYRAEQS